MCFFLGNKEIYRIQTEGPEASFCNSKMEFVSQVLGTDPSKKFARTNTN